MVHNCYPSTWEVEVEDQKFKVILSYLGSLRLCLKLTNNKKKKLLMASLGDSEHVQNSFPSVLCMRVCACVCVFRCVLVCVCMKLDGRVSTRGHTQAVSSEMPSTSFEMGDC